MGDERPVVLKKRKLSELPSGSQLTCIVHYDQVKDGKLTQVTEETFQRIQEAVSVRQSLSKDAWRLDPICAKVPSSFDKTKHGYHRWCYSNFNNVKKYVKVDSGQTVTTVTGPQVRTSGRKVPKSARESVLLPQDECIFCKKNRIKRRGNIELLKKCKTEKAEISIKESALSKQDFSIIALLSLYNLREREARYHTSCRKAYIRREDRYHHQQRERAKAESAKIAKEKAAQDAAFEHVCQYVEENIVSGSNIERMTMLRGKYLQYIQENASEYYNPNYRTQKLKLRLITRFGSKLQFWQPMYKSELVFSSNIQTGEAVEAAFAAASETKILEQAAAILRRQIESAHHNSEDLPWPPSSEYLVSDAVHLPESLQEFISLVISGKSCAKSNTKTNVIARSLAEDVCSATTRGRWKMPKHILLSMTIRTLTGRADLLTMLNRYGHCQSYSSTLELETAIAYQVQQADSILPSNISVSGNRVAHLCWDNFDINEETKSGAGTTHSTHGIVIQEINANESVSVCESRVVKSTSRSYKHEESVLPICLSKHRVEPVLVLQSNLTDILSTKANSVSLFSTSIWAFCRALYNNNFTVPDWCGWVSKTAVGNTVESQSRVGYMAPLLSPITDYETVQECLVRSMQVSRKLQQEYTLVTMDLAAAKIAYDIIWDSGERFAKVIMNIGAFHTMCSYMGAIGKMMTGSGFEDILIESGLCASGSINQVMNGKHYNRAMRVHQRMLDALERMLLEKFISQMEEEWNSEDLPLHEVAADPSRANLLAAEENSSIILFCQKYNEFKSKTRNGLLGKTAQFWLQYCDCVWILLQFQKSVKENNYDDFVCCLRQLCSLLFSADYVHYARYLPLYYIQLASIPASHPGAHLLLKECGLSVSRSAVPGSRNAIDLTIEQTINRSAKTNGGVIGFSRKAGAYYRWCMTRHKRASYVETTMKEIGMLEDPTDSHKSTRPMEIKRSETDVDQLKSTFTNFLNPFTTEGENQQHLFCLSSGQCASETVANDLLNYVSAGKRAADKFFQARLIQKTTKFQEPLKKSRLSTFQSMAVKVKVTAGQNKTVQIKAERDLFGRLLMLSQAHNSSIEKLFEYPLGPIPWSIATADGNLVKTDKSQLMHFLEAKISLSERVPFDKSTYVIDGNAHFQALVHLPDTFEELAFHIFNTLPKSNVLHFVTDTYKEETIKQLERDRRGSSNKRLIEGSKTKLPRDFKSFLHNSENKKQLIQLLLKEWMTQRYAPLIVGRQILFVCEEKCISLETSDGSTVNASLVEELCSSQEEADTRIILHCLFAARHLTSDKKITVRSPDTDVLVLLISYCAEIGLNVFFDTGVGNKRRLISINSIAAEIKDDISKALPGFHAFTGCDCTSAFVRKGKKGPFKQLTSNVKFAKVFQQLGTHASIIPESMFQDLERFVCIMYNKPAYSDTNRLRSDLFQSRYEPKSQNTAFSIKSGIDLSLLPPCRASLRMHVRRANYQAFIWKNAHIAYADVPSPDGCGWHKKDKQLLITWIEGHMMPPSLLKILMYPETSNQHDEKCTENSSDNEEYPDSNTEDEEFANELQMEPVEEEEPNNNTADEEYTDEREQFEQTEEDELDNILDIIFDNTQDDDEYEV